MRSVIISIIIPTYNRANLLSETIRSVYQQSFEYWELIIVDDGSTDNTKDVVQPFLVDKRITYVMRPENRMSGGNAARNYGFELARGNYIKWLDSDDLLHLKCLELQMDRIIKDKSDVCFCRSRFFYQNPNTDEIELGARWHPRMDSKGQHLEEFILGKIRFSNNDGLWRKDVLGKSPFNENLKNSQEFLMLIKMLSKKVSVSLIDQDLVLVRNHRDRMENKRSYTTFYHNQILARHLAVKELINNRIIGTPRLYIYLIKSMVYYFVQTIKKGKLKYIFKHIYLIIKTILLFLKISL